MSLVGNFQMTSDGKTDATSAALQLSEDRVALGDYSPRAPTDPYVRTLPHTVPQIMASLRT